MIINTIEKENVIDYLNKLEDNSIDLAIIDPPYNQNIDKWDTFSNEDEYFKFTKEWLDLMLLKLKNTGSFYIFNNPYNSAVTLNYLREKDVIFKNWIVWQKKDGFGPTKTRYVNNQEVILFYTMSDNYTFNADEIRVPYDSKSRMKNAETKGIIKNGKRWFPNPNGKLCTDVWNFSSHRHKTKLKGRVVKSVHPTPKPENLVKRMILASSNENDLVLDLFSGTGTTAYVAKKLNRNYIGCEINENYIKIINDRLRSLDM